MNRKLFIGLSVAVLLLTLLGTVLADDPYTFTLSEAASKTEETEYWYAKLSAPQISGMADEEEQAKLNEYFLSYLDWVYNEYETDSAYFSEHFDGEGTPHFGYEYYFETIAENDDWFVFRTAVFYAAGSSMTVNEYWPLNKHTGKLAELTDVADTVRLEDVRDFVFQAMERENNRNNGEIFWLDRENFDAAFSFIEEYHHWYVNEKGNLVITFDKYEIAPGSMGELCFEILDDKAVLIKDQEDRNWYLKITTPVIDGLADEQTEDLMNTYFAELAEGIRNEFEAAVMTAEESTTDDDGPHFGFEYFYEILADTENYFSFRTVAFFAAGSSMTSCEYWTLDKNTGKLVEWQDVLPEGGTEAIHDQIFAEMQAANESGEGLYYTDDDSLNIALANVPLFRHWYLNADEDLVIAFDKYEVAIGAQGNPEFVIK